MEAAWQDVQHKAADELGGMEPSTVLAWPPPQYNNVAVALALQTGQMSARIGDPGIVGPEWWKVKEEEEQRRIEETARLQREEKARRISEPVPDGSDWGER